MLIFGSFKSYVYIHVLVYLSFLHLSLSLSIYLSLSLSLSLYLSLSLVQDSSDHEEPVYDTVEDVVGQPLASLDNKPSAARR